MKNTLIKDVVNGVVSNLLSAKEGIGKTVTPEKTAHEKRQEWLNMSQADIDKMVKEDPDKAIPYIVKHMGRQ